jgi:hypothetical protein
MYLNPEGRYGLQTFSIVFRGLENGEEHTSSVTEHLLLINMWSTRYLVDPPPINSTDSLQDMMDVPNPPNSMRDTF